MTIYLVINSQGKLLLRGGTKLVLGTTPEPLPRTDTGEYIVSENGDVITYNEEEPQ